MPTGEPQPCSAPLLTPQCSSQPCEFWHVVCICKWSFESAEAVDPVQVYTWSSAVPETKFTTNVLLGAWQPNMATGGHTETTRACIPLHCNGSAGCCCQRPQLDTPGFSTSVRRLDHR